jgi:hypothetical protein
MSILNNLLSTLGFLQKRVIEIQPQNTAMDFESQAIKFLCKIPGKKITPICLGQFSDAVDPKAYDTAC